MFFSKKNKKKHAQGHFLSLIQYNPHHSDHLGLNLLGNLLRE